MASIATAEVTVGMGFARFGTELFRYNTQNENSTVEQIPWWAWNGRFNIDIAGHDEGDNVGFLAQLFYVGNNLWGVGDNAKAWLNLGPARLTFGRIVEGDLRGDHGDWGLARGVDESCVIFQEFNRIMGIHLDLTLDNLYMFVGAGVPAGCGSVNVVDYYKGVQGGIGYTIDGVGQIKAQYVGHEIKETTAKATDKSEYFEVGFKSGDLVDGLLLQLSARVHPEYDFNEGMLSIPVSVIYTGAENLTIRFYGQYQSGSTLSIDAFNKGATDNTYQSVGGIDYTVLKFGLDGMYTMDALDLGATTQFVIGIGSDTAYAIGVTPFLQYHVGPGFVMTGVNMLFANNGSKSYTEVAIPIGIQFGL